MPVTVTPGPSRLARIIVGAVREPERTIIIGNSGVGKTTFAACAPNPIFATAEEGASQIGVARFTPDGYEGLIADMKALATEPHDFKTFVLDTLDAFEPMLWEHVAKGKGKDNIEDLGYGKGYIMALDPWAEFLRRCDDLRKARGMEIILIAHAVAKNFANPAGPDYKRYEPALNEKAANLVKGWADNILFATFEGGVIDKSGKLTENVAEKGKNVETGRRVMRTRRAGGWDAKNRLNLPAEMEFSYKAFAAAADDFWSKKPGYLDPRPLYAECLEILGQPTSEAGKTALEFVTKNQGNGPALKKALDRLKEIEKENVQ